MPTTILFFQKPFHEKNALRAFAYVLRDVLCTVVVYKLGWMFDPFSESRSLVEDFRLAPVVGTLVNWFSWALYWYCHVAGWWCMAHEAGHGPRYNFFLQLVNLFIGFTLHTVRTHFLSIS